MIFSCVSPHQNGNISRKDTILNSGQYDHLMERLGEQPDKKPLNGRHLWGCERASARGWL
jgi:hypothetical protein